MTGRRIIIIGGGISGLAAAHRLIELARQQKTPLDITLLEASPRIGGVIHTIKRNGFLIESGPDNFITNKPWAMSLAQRLGIDPHLQQTRQCHRRAMVVRRGKLLPIPAGFLLMAPTRWWPMVTSPLLSWRGKLRMAIEPFIRAHRGNIDESLTSFVTRRFGRQLLDRLVQPLVGGIYTADPDLLSLRATLPQFLEMEARYGSVWRGLRRQVRKDGSAESGARYSLFATFKEGMQTLVDGLGERIGPQRLCPNTPVTRVGFDSDRARWRVTVHQGTHLEADGVIIATPSYHAASMLRELDAPLARQLSTLAYASSAIVNLAYKRQDISSPLDAFGFVVPAIENRTILAGSFSSIKYDGRAPKGDVLIRAFLGGALQPQVLDLDDNALASAAQHDLRNLLGATAPPEWVTIHRWPRSMPQYTVGHMDRVKAIRSSIERLTGLELAGNAYEGVGIPDCIHAGEQAALRLFSGLKTVGPSGRPTS